MPNSDGSKKKWKCGKRAGKQQKEKQAASSQSHSHIASVVYTSGLESIQDPCALAHHPMSLYQGEQCPSFHTGIKDAIALAHWLDIPISMENICRLDSGLTTHGPGFLSSVVCLPSPLSSFNTFTSSSIVMLDSSPSLLATRLEPIYELDQLTYKLELDSSPAKCSKRACHNQIMAPTTNYWDEDDGFIRMCSSVSFPLYTSHDPLMVALAPTASSHINICGSVHLCNKNHCKACT